MAGFEALDSCHTSGRRGGLFLPLSILVHGAVILGFVALSVAPAELQIAPHTVVRFPPPLAVVKADTPEPPRGLHPAGGGRGGGARPRPAPVAEPQGVRAESVVDQAIDDTPLSPCEACSNPGPLVPDLPPGPSGAGEPQGGVRTVRVSDVRPPRKIHDVKPEYPPLARAAHLEGIVVLECTIGVDGKITELHVLGGKPMLTDAALDAVRQWVYAPTLLDGVPVAVVMTVTVNFLLPR
jgi:protein TonB